MQSKQWWRLCAALALVAVALAAEPRAAGAPAGAPLREPRGARGRESCRYVRGAWSDCEPSTNVRSRKLTLKKGDPASCEPVKTVQKKCKKACRYEKSAWSECGASGEMSRTDLLKANSDAACDKSRRLTKKCNKNKHSKAPKDKGRRSRQ